MVHTVEQGQGTAEHDIAGPDLANNAGEALDGTFDLLPGGRFRLGAGGASQLAYFTMASKNERRAGR
jgi:hypothetical protein